MEYKIIEDNGGGLHMFVWNSGEVCVGMGNLEFMPTEDFLYMLAEMESADTTLSEIEQWEGLYTDPRQVYAELTSYDFGQNVIARGVRGKREICPSLMGAAGKKAFGIMENWQ